MERIKSVISFLNNTGISTEDKLPIFPLQPFTKIPYSNGLGSQLHKAVINDNQLIDKKLLDEFWLHNPESNWAIKTGDISNLTILDVDNKDNFKGSKFIEKNIDFKYELYKNELELF